jgi:hypothetical protein
MPHGAVPSGPDNPMNQREDPSVADEEPEAQRLERIWREDVEGAVRDRLFKIDASEAMETEILTRMKERYVAFTSVLVGEDGFARAISLSGQWSVSPTDQQEIEAAFRVGVSKLFGQLVGTMVNELLDLEISVYRAEHPWY